MTEQEHQLLYKDICARLPYGLVVCQSAQYSDSHFAYSTADKWQKEPHDFNIIGVNGRNTLITDKNMEEMTYAKGIGSKPVTICIYDGLTKQTARPYLRPMSSMTEEEKHKLLKFGAITCLENGEVIDVSCVGFERHADVQDYLNTCHFDYHGLIEKGLALEAPESMYCHT